MLDIYIRKKKRRGLVHATLRDGSKEGMTMSLCSIGILFLMIGQF